MGFELHPNVVAQDLYVSVRKEQAPEVCTNDPAGNYLQWHAPILAHLAKDLVDDSAFDDNWLARLQGAHGAFMINKGRYYWRFDTSTGLVVFRRYIENCDFVPGVNIVWRKGTNQRTGKVIGKTQDDRLNVIAWGWQMGEAIEYEDIIAIDIGIVLDGVAQY